MPTRLATSAWSSRQLVEVCEGYLSNDLPGGRVLPPGRGRRQPAAGSGVVGEQGEMAGAPHWAQAAQVPLVQGENGGGAFTVGEDHVRCVGDADVVAVVAKPGDDFQRCRAIGSCPLSEVVRLAGHVGREPAGGRRPESGREHVVGLGETMGETTSRWSSAFASTRAMAGCSE